VLVEQGALNDGEVEFALRTQVETGEGLGKILVDLGLVCRPALARPLPGNRGSSYVKSAASGRVSAPR
jgi:hypothetical protein